MPQRKRRASGCGWGFGALLLFFSAATVVFLSVNVFPTTTTTTNYPDWFDLSAIARPQILDPDKQLDCRLAHQEYHSSLYQEWMDANQPILVSVIVVDQQPHALFFLRHMNRRLQKLWMYESTIRCDSGDGTAIPGDPASKFDFNLVVRCPSSSPAEEDLQQQIHNITFEIPELKSQYTYNETVLSMVQACEERRPAPPPPPPRRDDNTWTTSIAACTSVRGDYAALEEWIAYHRMIGVRHFRVYVNEPWSDAHPVLRRLRQQQHRDDVTLVPYEFHIDRYRPDWHPEFSWFQAAINNDCLYRHRDYDWVMTTDMDEFVHVAHPTASDAPEPLTAFLSGRVTADPPSSNNIIGLILSPVFYGAHPSGNETGRHHPKLLLDYTWRRDDPLSAFTGRYGRVKVLYRPRRVRYVEVHRPYATAGEGEGGELVQLQADAEAHLQHYKNPSAGVFRVKPGERVRRDPGLRQKYRAVVLEQLGDK